MILNISAGLSKNIFFYKLIAYGNSVRKFVHNKIDKLWSQEQSWCAASLRNFICALPSSQAIFERNFYLERICRENLSRSRGQDGGGEGASVDHKADVC